MPYVEPNQSIFKLERIADLFIPKQGGFRTGPSMPDLREPKRTAIQQEKDVREALIAPVFVPALSVRRL